MGIGNVKSGGTLHIVASHASLKTQDICTRGLILKKTSRNVSLSHLSPSLSAIPTAVASHHIEHAVVGVTKDFCDGFPFTPLLLDPA